MSIGSVLIPPSIPTWVIREYVTLKSNHRFKQKKEYEDILRKVILNYRK